MKGYVYFIQMDDNHTNPIKIGFSQEPKKRLKILDYNSPYGLKMIGYIDGDRKLEKEIHKKFKKYNIRGEWFQPSEAILDYLEKTIFMENTPSLSLTDAIKKYKLYETAKKIERKENIRKCNDTLNFYNFDFRVNDEGKFIDLKNKLI